ncbi:hypothetical protein M758_3G151100 [Ceratodon purpureus]|nr:hypothetical protein M758_3G151100 [Ceratodon purpureus]
MQGARVLARAVAALGRHYGSHHHYHQHAKYGVREFAEVFEGFAGRVGQDCRAGLSFRGVAGRAGVGSLASSSLFSKAHVVTRGCRMSTISVGAGSVKEAVSLVKGGVVAQKRVGTWLFGCTGWVFSMVVLGGVTRLTRSGLSMTDWKFVGSLPPLTEEQWQMEFLKYQSSPEYRRVNRGMSLNEFKFIFWMEYAHRMWGRALGIVFAGPFAYFVLRGYITQRLGLRLSALMTMGAAQGFVGWWMVKSGLEEPETEYVQPRVSPYRLAAHLTSAFAIYSGLFWTALSVTSPFPTISGETAKAAMKVRRFAIPVAALVGITAVSGAFVAGNDAGHAYNTFPKMGDDWIPEGLMDMKPFFRNFFENTATVQLDHRILATTTLLSVTGMWAATRKLPLDPRVRTLLNATFGMAALQVTLGISTLLMYVPVSLGAAHQAGALTLFSIVLSLVHALRRPLPGSMAATQKLWASKVSL